MLFALHSFLKANLSDGDWQFLTATRQRAQPSLFEERRKTTLASISGFTVQLLQHTKAVQFIGKVSAIGVAMPYILEGTNPLAVLSAASSQANAFPLLPSPPHAAMYPASAQPAGPSQPPQSIFPSSSPGSYTGPAVPPARTSQELSFPLNP